MTATRRGIFTPELLDRCISCGFCLPACPTYDLTAVETSSPRGRINLMRALEDGTLGDDDPTVAEESSFCLGCRACEPVCPAGVQYGALLEEWRDHLWTRPPPAPASCARCCGPSAPAGACAPWASCAVTPAAARPGPASRRPA